jgi:hypothetical protein
VVIGFVYNKIEVLKIADLYQQVVIFNPQERASGRVVRIIGCDLPNDLA